MNIYNKKLKSLSKNLNIILNNERIKRNFNIENYIEEKSLMINNYMKDNKLSSCVIGISGGIDSAITLALLNNAKEDFNSPIKNIICVYMPVENGSMSNVDDSYQRSLDLCQYYNINLIKLDLTEINKNYNDLISSSLNIEADGWSKGQLVSYSRTPALYYTTTLLNQNNNKSIVIGTINKDEGSYIGYVGKAGDGMVDVQLISDIHKSEVYKIAKYFKLPKSIIKAIPSGDMYDSRTDEDVFGTSYDFIELYQYYLLNNKIIDCLNEHDKNEFFSHAQNVENLHSYNKHKYLACSQAIHLDILPSKIPNGWNYNTYKKLDYGFINQKLIYKDFLDIFDLNYKLNPKSEISYLKFPDNKINKSKKIEQINNVLTINESNSILDFLNTKEWINVGYDGILKNFDSKSNNIGSQRISIFSEELASILWNRIKNFYSNVNANKYSFFDNDSHQTWKPIGINPLFRFIKYENENLLVNHYDSPFVIDGNKRTIKTLVIYLTNNKQGKTRFFKDKQDLLMFNDRSFNDWKTSGNIDDLDIEFLPTQGNTLTFDHRILHDSEPISSNETKIIIRTDIVFEKALN